MKIRLLYIAVTLIVFASANTGMADRHFDRMISPVTNPVNFEDPRARTELRAIYAYHKIANDFITGGGDVRIYALQARFALNDRLALIATKDGWVDFNPNGVLDDESGFANIAFGFKYALMKDDNAGNILTGGLRYELPSGNTDVLQGRGDGFVNPFLSGAMALEGMNVMAGTGLRLPLDDDDSTFYDFDMHVDVPVGQFYPSLELNVVHVLDAGNRLPIADEGQDFFSFGAIDSDGKTIVTGAVGGRYRLSDSVDWGFGYQFPLTSGKGSNITDWRVTSDLIFSIPE
jgi:hypothetical protein